MNIYLSPAPGEPSTDTHADVDRPTLVFLHIPKTAGSSLGAMVEGQLKARESYRVGGPGELLTRHPLELKKYRFIHGHFDWSELGAIPNPKRVISMLRKPIDRVLSLYWYWRSFSWEFAESTQDAGIIFAKTVGLEQFFFDAPLGIRANYENAVVRQLVGADFCSPYVGFTITDAQATDLAKRNIDRMEMCGITEEFNGAAVKLASILCLPALSVRYDNTLGGRQFDRNYDHVAPTPPSERLLHHLQLLTALDTEVYNYAARSSDRRSAAVMSRAA